MARPEDVVVFCITLETCFARQSSVNLHQYADYQKSGMFTLPRNHFGRNTADALPKMQRLVVRPLRSWASARHRFSRCDCSGRGEISMGWHVALSLCAT